MNMIFRMVEVLDELYKMNGSPEWPHNIQIGRDWILGALKHYTDVRLPEFFGFFKMIITELSGLIFGW